MSSQPPPLPGAKQYWAFLSYSHQDERACARLHGMLETYRIPRRLVGKQTAIGPVPPRVMPVFRDRDELPTSADLGRSLRDVLQASRSLIILCSSRSANSLWVNEEVLTFKSSGRGDRIFCVILDGEPNAADKPGLERQECFVPALRFEVNRDGSLSHRRAEPIAADLRIDGWRNAKLKLIAGITGLGYDELRQRDRKRALRQRLVWAVTAMTMAVFLAAIAIRYYGKSLEVAEARGETVEARNVAQKAQVLATTTDYVEAIVSAAKELNDGHPAGVRPILARCPRELRRWEWYYLWAAADRAQHSFHSGEGRVRALATDASGRYLAAGGAGGAVQLWDAARRSPVGAIKLAPPVSALERHSSFRDPLAMFQDQFTSLAFSGDGTMLATGDTGGRVVVWKTPSGEQIREVHELGEAVQGLTFIADGSMLFASSGKNVIGWSTSNWKEIVHIDAKDGDIGDLGVALTEDGHRLIAAGGNAVRVWNATGPREAEQEWNFAIHDRLTAFAASGDGRLVCTGHANGQLILRSSSESSSSNPTRGDGQRVAALALDAHGSQVASASGNVVLLWGMVKDPHFGSGLALRERLVGHQADVACLCFSADGGRLYSADETGDIRVWEQQTRPEATLRVSGSVTRNSIAFSPKTGLIASVDVASGDGNLFDPESTHRRGVNVLIDDVRTGERRWTLQGHENTVSMIQFSDDGKRLMSFGYYDVWVWDLGTGEPLLHVNTLQLIGGASSVVFSPDGRRLAIAGSRLAILDVDTKAEQTIDVDFGPLGLAGIGPFSSDGALLPVMVRDKTVRLLDPISGTEVSRMSGFERPPAIIAFSPDSTLMVTAGLTEKSLSLWDVAKGVRRTSLRGHEGLIRSVAFSSDGKRILTGSGDGTVRLWDAETGKSPLMLDFRESSLPKTYVELVAWADDDRTVVVACGSKVVVWPTSEPSEQDVSSYLKVVP